MSKKEAMDYAYTLTEKAIKAVSGIRDNGTLTSFAYYLAKRNV